MAVKETVNAGKVRNGRKEALALAKQAHTVIAARGSKVVTFDMKKATPDDETLVSHLLGPTGNLRAPSFRLGKTLVVGFSEETYRQVLGK